MAFVLASIPYLDNGGDLLAVLPAGILKTEKDKAARELLMQRFDLEVVATNGRTAFAGCNPRTILVHLRLSGKSPKTCQSTGSAMGAQRRRPGGDIVLKRGTVQMHTVAEGLPEKSLALVHSTELIGGRADTTKRRASEGRSVINGPAVLLPRVGQPSKEKVCLYLARKRIVISDCVFALACKHSEQARTLQKMFIRNWATIEQEYGGTCAPYLTVRSLIQLCRHFGFKVTSA